MMAKGASTCLFFSLLFLLLVITICSSSTSGTDLVGFSYHANANAGRESRTVYSSSPSLSLSNKVGAASASASQSQIRVFVSDHDHTVLRALSRSGVSVDLHLNESLVENLRSCGSSSSSSSNAAAAVSWLKSHLLALLPQVDIKSVVVGVGGGAGAIEDELAKLLSNLKSVHSHLSRFNLPRQVKVSVAFPSSFLQKMKRMRSEIRFRDDVARIFGFINKYGSLVMVELDDEDGQAAVLKMGLGSDEFVQSVIELVMTTCTLACNCNCNTDRSSCTSPPPPIPIVVVVKSPAVPSATSDDYEAAAAEFTAKVEKSLGTRKTEITDRIRIAAAAAAAAAALYNKAQVVAVPEIILLGYNNLERIDFIVQKQDEQMMMMMMMMMMRFVSSPAACCSPRSSSRSRSRRELLQNNNNNRGVRNTAHDNIINIPTAPVSSNGNGNDPTPTPTPTIVTVDPSSTNPVTVAPTNPAGTPQPFPTTTPVTGTPQPFPTTTPVTVPVPVPSTNPTNPITNPVTVPVGAGGAQQQPVTNPVTTYPAPTGGVPVSTPVTTVPPPSSATPTTTTNAPPGGQQSWCVARSGASEASLQAALDYACGMGGADCSQIQQGANCYNPNTLQNHASYAFNSYYQNNPAPTSCDFGGSAAIVNTNPSSGSCIYPSSSASQSTATPTSTPPAATSSTSGAGAGAGTGVPGSVTPPSVLNSSSPTAAGGGGGVSGGTSSVFGSDTPPGVNTSTTSMSSMSPPLHSSLSCCIIMLSTCFVTGLIFLHL